MKKTWTEAETIPFYYVPSVDRVFSPVNPEDLEDLRFYAQTEVRVRASLSGRNGEIAVDNDLMMIPVQSYCTDRPARPERIAGRTILYPERDGMVAPDLPIVVISRDGILDFHVEFHAPLFTGSGSGYKEIISGDLSLRNAKTIKKIMYRLSGREMRRGEYTITLRYDQWMKGMPDVRKLISKSLVSDDVPDEMPDVEVDGVPANLAMDLIREMGFIAAYYEEDACVFELIHGFYQELNLDIPGTKGRRWCRVNTGSGPVFYGGDRIGNHCDVLFVRDGQIVRKEDDLYKIILAGQDYLPPERGGSDE